MVYDAYIHKHGKKETETKDFNSITKGDTILILDLEKGKIKTDELKTLKSGSETKVERFYRGKKQYKAYKLSKKCNVFSENDLEKVKDNIIYKSGKDSIEELLIKGVPDYLIVNQINNRWFFLEAKKAGTGLSNSQVQWFSKFSELPIKIAYVE